jgi:hypothetical protein
VVLSCFLSLISANFRRFSSSLSLINFRSETDWSFAKWRIILPVLSVVLFTLGIRLLTENLTLVNVISGIMQSSLLILSFDRDSDHTACGLEINHKHPSLLLATNDERKKKKYQFTANVDSTYSNICPTRCNVTQFILTEKCSTCFAWYHQPSLGAQTTVSTASSICHTVIAICRYRGRVGTGLSVLWVAFATHSTLTSIPTLPR